MIHTTAAPQLSTTMEEEASRVLQTYYILIARTTLARLSRIAATPGGKACFVKDSFNAIRHSGIGLL